MTSLTNDIITKNYWPFQNCFNTDAYMTRLNDIPTCIIYLSRFLYAVIFYGTPGRCVMRFVTTWRYNFSELFLMPTSHLHQTKTVRPQYPIQGRRDQEGTTISSSSSTEIIASSNPVAPYYNKTLVNVIVFYLDIKEI